MAEFEIGPKFLTDLEREEMQELLNDSQVEYQGRVSELGIFVVSNTDDFGRVVGKINDEFVDFGGELGERLVSFRALELMSTGVDQKELSMLVDHSQTPPTLLLSSPLGTERLDLEGLRYLNVTHSTQLTYRTVNEDGVLVIAIGRDWVIGIDPKDEDLSSDPKLVFLDLTYSGETAEGLDLKKTDGVVINRETKKLVPWKFID